jgi:hypothetical protein
MNAIWQILLLCRRRTHIALSFWINSFVHTIIYGDLVWRLRFVNSFLWSITRVIHLGSTSCEKSHCSILRNYSTAPKSVSLYNSSSLGCRFLNWQCCRRHLLLWRYIGLLNVEFSIKKCIFRNHLFKLLPTKELLTYSYFRLKCLRKVDFLYGLNMKEYFPLFFLINANKYI